MQKLILALLGLAFAFAIASSFENEKKCESVEPLPFKEKQEKFQRRW